MKILSVNAGSSSLKFTVTELPEQTTIASGLFERIGIDGGVYTIKLGSEKIKKEVHMNDHSQAVEILMTELIDLKIVSSLEEIEGIGHRVVHGGDQFSKSVILTEETINEIDKYTELAPLHNPANIMGIRAFMAKLPNVLNVAVFDTAFHQTMDKVNYIYPVPYSWYEDFGVRKYGFHGTSHKYIDKSISEKFGKDNLKVISCHVGNGASIAAIDSHNVVDTSMGFTPLAGLMMGTRSGDIDASMIEYVMQKTGKTIKEITNDLNKNSGLLGVSGISSDGRDIEAAVKEGNERGILAQNIYVQKIANYVAMYNNILGGADVICLTAGVLENGIDIRRLLLDKIASLGVKIDNSKNDFRGEFREISTEDSKIPVYVVPTNEELMIALEVAELK